MAWMDFLLVSRDFLWSLLLSNELNYDTGRTTATAPNTCFFNPAYSVAVFCNFDLSVQLLKRIYAITFIQKNKMDLCCFNLTVKTLNNSETLVWSWTQPGNGRTGSSVPQSGCSPRGQEQERLESARALNLLQKHSRLEFKHSTLWVSIIVLCSFSWELCFTVAV